MPANVAVIDSVLADSTKLKDKVVYVDFWASWCGPCAQSFPYMKVLQSKYQPKGLQIVTINLDKDTQAAQDFLDKMKSPLQVVYDSTGTLAKRYGLDAMPSSFIYGRNGLLRASHQGFLPKDTTYLDSLVASLIEEKRQQ